jgi:RNA polymerase sigma factor (sigma-70 family)
MIAAGRTHGIDEDSLRSALIASAPRIRGFIDSKLPARLRASICVDDVLQDIWIAAFRTRASLRIDRPDAVDRWLTSIAQSRLLNTIKTATRVKRGGKAEIIRSDRSYVDLFARVASRIKTPSSEVASGEASKAVRAALATLPDSRREVLEQRFLRGKSSEQIATATNRSLAQVNSLLFHGLRQLEKELGPACAYLSDAASADDEAQADASAPVRST